MATLGFSDILLLIAIIVGIYFFIRLVRYSIKTKKRFIIFLFSFLTTILLLSLPFHYLVDRNKVLLKANFTFSNTFVTDADIDKLTENYNNASVTEKFAIMNEPFFRTLSDAGIIFDTKKRVQNENKE